MSSFNNGGVINRKKGSIVLFQHGIFGNEDSFTEAIAKLVKQAPNRHIAFPDTFINMNSFKKMGYNNTYLFETPESQLEFNDTIKNIALFAKDHPNHNILVRTRLSGINKADSIQNQKEKLALIVRRLYDLIDGRPIVLVGHSQGGLVNMETALKCPSYIDKIISLNTPFSVNSIGRTFFPIATFCHRFGIPLNAGIDTFDFKDDDVYHALGTLVNFVYFADLKKRWESATNKPTAIALAGLAGVLTDKRYEYDSTFDGLVMVSDFQNIKVDKIHFFMEERPKCPDGWPEEWFWDKDYTNRCTFCREKCVFPKMSFVNTLGKAADQILDALINDGINSILNGTKYEFKEIEIIKAINAGLNKTEYTGPEQTVYKIYSSKYNHLHIQTNSEVLTFLSGLLY
jgi:pimeloyl-ACP methyl ester carboxylesterase